MMVDIYSRFIVGAHVQATESGALAEENDEGNLQVHGIPQVAHADRQLRRKPSCAALRLGPHQTRVSNDASPISQ
jgi:hypothetical protein